MSEPENDAPDKSALRRMLTEEQVLAVIPISRTTLYRMEKAGRFPKSTYISAKPPDLVRRRGCRLAERG